MKIRITNNSKKVLTVAEMPIVKAIIEDFKEDVSVEEYAAQAAEIASGENGKFEILKATAEISKNRRVWNLFSEKSNHLDVWIEVYAFNEFYGFYNIGVYLSDLWSRVGGENDEEIRQRMYINKYTSSSDVK